MHEYTTSFGTVIGSVGYVERGARDWIQTRMIDYPQVFLLDIRLSARSRWFPDWNKGKLQKTWGERYLHDPRLGNENYRARELPIQLADPQPALRDAVALLRSDWSLILLCACKNYDQCHRKMVFELLFQRCQDVSDTLNMYFDVDRNLYMGLIAENKHVVCVRPDVFDTYRRWLSPQILYDVNTWIMHSYEVQSDEVWIEEGNQNAPSLG